MKTTHILYSKAINQSKYCALEKHALILGRLRSDIWQMYGSIHGIESKDRHIRDSWMKERKEFLVPANSWKETLRDTIANIKANRESAKEKVRKSIHRHTKDDEQKKKLFTELKYNKWRDNNYLRRMMRKYWLRGHNKTFNQIVVRSDDYSVFELNGMCWLKISSMTKGHRISIPLNTTMAHAPKGTLRLILKNNVVEVHHFIEKQIIRPCGLETIGIDKGYTEVYVDSDGESYEKGFGQLLGAESDKIKEKYKKRSKLYAISHKKLHKKKNIEIHNLGRKKLDKQSDIRKQKIKTKIFTATHKLFDKACKVVAEDLTATFSSKSFGKNMNRKLSAWTKGIMAEALETVSQLRGSELALVNSAYTSQTDSFCGGLFVGHRKGQTFYRENGENIDADHNAARNVLARLYDHEIGRWMKQTEVKSILQKRTEAYRLKLANLDSSYKPILGH